VTLDRKDHGRRDTCAFHQSDFSTPLCEVGQPLCKALLAEELYPQAEKIRVALDNLSTPTAAACYESFSAEVARRLARRIEFCYTPVHGSWLNMVEIKIYGQS
jgi:hypothetical protein